MSTGFTGIPEDGFGYELSPYELGMLNQSEGACLLDNPCAYESPHWSMWREGFLTANGTTLLQYWTERVTLDLKYFYSACPPLASRVDAAIYVSLWYNDYDQLWMK